MCVRGLSNPRPTLTPISTPSLDLTSHGRTAPSFHVAGARNWFQGSPGNAGQWGPRFSAQTAPALLGFDDAIDHYTDNHNGGMGHSAAAIAANVNILQLWSPASYSVCAPSTPIWMSRSASLKF